MFKFIRNYLVVSARMSYNLATGIPAIVRGSKKFVEGPSAPEDALEGLREFVRIMYNGVDREAVVYNLEVGMKFYQGVARAAQSNSQLSTMFSNQVENIRAMVDVLKENSGALSGDELNKWVNVAMEMAAKHSAQTRANN